MEHVGYRLQTIVLVSKQHQEELSPPSAAAEDGFQACGR